MKKQTLTLHNGETIEYQLARRARRTVGLKITDDGLIVHAPRLILGYQLKNILLEKSNWIIKKLAAREQNKVPRIQWQDGEILLYLGESIQLTLQHHTTNKQIEYLHESIVIASPKITDTVFVERKVVQWYKKQALEDFQRRLEIFAAKLGVPTPPLRLSNAKSRWGSCSSDGVIRLNWRLMQAPPHIINYVTCHELAHLKEMNHSKQFWAIVEQLFPDYKAAETTLKKLSPQLHRF